MTRSITAPTASTASTACSEGWPQDRRSEQPLATVTSLRPGSIGDNRPAPRGLMRSEAGLATAEYAIATLAAVGFAALLVAVLSSGEIRGLLMSLITSALSFG